MSEYSYACPWWINNKIFNNTASVSPAVLLHLFTYEVCKKWNLLRWHTHINIIKLVSEKTACSQKTIFGHEKTFCWCCCYNNVKFVSMRCKHHNYWWIKILDEQNQTYLNSHLFWSTIIHRTGNHTPATIQIWEEPTKNGSSSRQCHL